MNKAYIYAMSLLSALLGTIWTGLLAIFGFSFVAVAPVILFTIGFLTIALVVSKS